VTESVVPWNFHACKNVISVEPSPEKVIVISVNKDFASATPIYAYSVQWLLDSCLVASEIPPRLQVETVCLHSPQVSFPDALRSLFSMALRIPLYQSINQSINLFVRKCNRHWTWHQGRIHPPLTGARKNNISKSYKWQYIREKIELTEKCSDPTFIIKLDNRRLKLEILVANTRLPGSLLQKFMTRLWNILVLRIFSIWFFFSLWLFPLVCKMQKKASWCHLFGLREYLFGIGSDCQCMSKPVLLFASHVLQCLAASVEDRRNQYCWCI